MSAFVCECLVGMDFFVCINHGRRLDFKSCYMWQRIGREHIKQLDNSLMELTQQKKVLKVINDL